MKMSLVDNRLARLRYLVCAAISALATILCVILLYLVIVQKDAFLIAKISLSVSAVMGFILSAWSFKLCLWAAKNRHDLIMKELLEE